MSRVARLLTAIASLEPARPLLSSSVARAAHRATVPRGARDAHRASTTSGVLPPTISTTSTGSITTSGCSASRPRRFQSCKSCHGSLGCSSSPGVVVVVAARRRLLYAWFVGFFALAAAGILDFWRWEYDYGHDLDFEHAIIKIPGMNYQPPLMGVKQLLNFTAVSWPDLGGWIAFASFALAAWRSCSCCVRRCRVPASTEWGAHQCLRGIASTCSTIAVAMMLTGAAPAAVRGEHGHSAPAPLIVNVSPDGPVRTVRDALSRVARGGTIVVHAGTYRDTTIVVGIPVAHCRRWTSGAGRRGQAANNDDHE